MDIDIVGLIVVVAVVVLTVAYFVGSSRNRKMVAEATDSNKKLIESNNRLTEALNRLADNIDKESK